MDTNDRKSEEADELEAKMEEREESRLAIERDEREDINQGMQTGTHDASHPGIKWSASYRVKEDVGEPSKKAKGKDSDV